MHAVPSLIIATLALSQRHYNNIVKVRSKLEELSVLTTGVDPVREENDVEILFRIDPDGRSREARVAKSRRRGAVSERASRNGFHPAHSASAGQIELALGEVANRVRVQIPVSSRIQQHPGQDAEVCSGGEEAGMSGDTAQEIGVLVVDLPHHDPIPPRTVFCRGETLGRPPRLRKNKVGREIRPGGK